MMKVDRAALSCGSPIAAMIAAVMLASGAEPTTQSVTEPALKAAFVNYFAKFTEWPPEALKPNAALTICVINDRAVGESLSGLTRGQAVAGHELAVRSHSKTELPPLAECRLLYVSSLDGREWSALLATVKGLPILTMSDLNRFGENGGVVQLIIEGGAVKFAINREAARRASLRLSSNVLGLAKFVKDDPNAIHP